MAQRRVMKQPQVVCCVGETSDLSRRGGSCLPHTTVRKTSLSPGWNYVKAIGWCVSRPWWQSARFYFDQGSLDVWQFLPWQLRQRRRPAAPINLPPPTLSHRLNERPRKAPPPPPTGQSKGGGELLWLWGRSVETRSQRRRRWVFLLGEETGRRHKFIETKKGPLLFWSHNYL